jgi:hypothetical protein
MFILPSWPDWAVFSRHETRHDTGHSELFTGCLGRSGACAFVSDNTKCQFEIQMSHFDACELLQQFRGFQRVGSVGLAISGPGWLEETERNVSLNANLYLNLPDWP